MHCQSILFPIIMLEELFLKNFLRTSFILNNQMFKIYDISLRETVHFVFRPELWSLTHSFLRIQDLSMYGLPVLIERNLNSGRYQKYLKNIWHLSQNAQDCRLVGTISRDFSLTNSFNSSLTFVNFSNKSKTWIVREKSRDMVATRRQSWAFWLRCQIFV